MKFYYILLLLIGSTWDNHSTSQANEVSHIPVGRATSGPAYDLVLKGARVLDPANHVDGIQDIAVKDGKIAKLAVNIPGEQARLSIDLHGLLIVPGLIDTHVHVFHGTDPHGGLRNGFSAVAPDAFSFRSGVTTMVDAGSSGWRDFPTFRQQTIAKSRTRILAFLNIVGHGMHGSESDQQDLSDMSVEQTAAVAKNHSDVIVGIKLAHYASDSWEPALRAVEAAKQANIRVMVDFGHSTPPLPLEKLFLEVMRPGDIFTHMYGNTPGRMTVVNTDGNVAAYSRKARERGIYFDLGHGGGSFAFSQAIPAIKQGFYPDVISTDLHTGSMNSAMRDILNTMAKMMSIGLLLEDVITMTTSNAAREINRPELGQLAVGSIADIAVLRLRNESVGFYDVEGHRQQGQQTLECEMTLKDGAVVFDRNARSFR